MLRARPRTTCDGCCAWPTSPRRCRSRRCSAPTARSPRTWSRCARSRARPRSAANLRALLAGSPIVASHRYGDDRVQDAYSLRCAPQVNGAARDTLAHAERVRRAPSSRRRSTTRWCCPTAASSRAATSTARRSGSRCDFLAIAVAEVGAIAERRTDRLLDASALARAAAVPHRRAGRQLRADDRPVHAGGAGGREPPARRARERRLAADQRDAGGPRLDGLGGRAQAAHARREPRAHPRRRADVRRARARPARAAAARRRDGARRCAALRARIAGPGPGPPARAGPRRGRGAGHVGRAARRRRGRRSGRWHERARRSARRAAPSCPARAGRRRPRCGC